MSIEIIASIYGAIAGGVFGAIVGGIINYISTRSIDAARKHENKCDSQKAFDYVCEQMPKLINNMRNDLKQNPNRRSILVMPNREIICCKKDCFIYYKNEIDCLMEKLNILADLGYIVDSRMQEHFVQLILKG